MLRISPLILIKSLLPVLAACQTDNERYNIGRTEPITPPEGMFVAREDQQSKASKEVIFYFKSNPEKLRANPVIAVQSMAYFEWLVNDACDKHDIPPRVIRDLIDGAKSFGMHSVSPRKKPCRPLSTNCGPCRSY